MDRFSLQKLISGHPTYHHFTGDGARDSQLDILISTLNSTESLVSVVCRNDNPIIQSAPDIILSSFSAQPAPHTHEAVPKALRVSKWIYWVLWHQYGIPSYCSILATSLPSLFTSMANPTSADDTSDLLSLTNQAVTQAAKKSFKVIDLSRPPQPWKPKSDPDVKYLSHQITKLSVALRKADISQ